jgi:hypothetical protein
VGKAQDGWSLLGVGDLKGRIRPSGKNGRRRGRCGAVKGRLFVH